MSQNKLRIGNPMLKKESEIFFLAKKKKLEATHCM